VKTINKASKVIKATVVEKLFYDIKKKLANV